jgi:hypothetical protein
MAWVAGLLLPGWLNDCLVAGPLAIELLAPLLLACWLAGWLLPCC